MSALIQKLIAQYIQQFIKNAQANPKVEAAEAILSRFEAALAPLVSQITPAQVEAAINAINADFGNPLSADQIAEIIAAGTDLEQLVELAEEYLKGTSTTTGTEDAAS